MFDFARPPQKSLELTLLDSRKTKRVSAETDHSDSRMQNKSKCSNRRLANQAEVLSGSLERSPFKISFKFLRHVHMPTETTRLFRTTDSERRLYMQFQIMMP